VFPSSRPSRRFPILVSLMVFCQQLLRENAIKTLRDVFYTDVNFYQTQDVVNRAALDLSSLLQVCQ
jgi:DNA topoisomerase VI subunit A